MGKVEEYTLKSARLGTNEKYGYPRQRTMAIGRLVLLVLFDGFSYLNWIPVPTILDNLIHAEKTPAMIAI